MKKIQQIIKNTTEENQNKINWTKAWSEKYPILKIYQKEVDIEKYSNEIKRLLKDIELTYGYSRLDSMLVLKDVLAHTYLDDNE